MNISTNPKPTIYRNLYENTRDNPMLDYCWPNVYDAGPTLISGCLMCPGMCLCTFFVNICALG